MEAKARLQQILAALTGHQTVAAACAELEMSERHLHTLRHQVLQDAVRRLARSSASGPPAPSTGTPGRAGRDLVSGTSATAHRPPGGSDSRGDGPGHAATVPAVSQYQKKGRSPAGSSDRAATPRKTACEPLALVPASRDARPCEAPSRTRPAATLRATPGAEADYRN